MSIRLLPKQELSRLQAQQRKTEIEEGTKLARRIDNLREIAAKEEVSLADFRNKTVKSISDEIKSIEKERESLINSVASLRKEIEVGKSELIEKEILLTEKLASLEEEKLTLNKQKTALKKLVDEVKSQEKNNLRYKQKLAYGYKVLENLEKEVLVRFQEANSYLSEAKTNTDKIYNLVSEVEKDLKIRDITVASKERDLIIRAEHLDERTERLRVKELSLIDREQTLEREYARNKK